MAVNKNYWDYREINNYLLSIKNINLESDHSLGGKLKNVC